MGSGNDDEGFIGVNEEYEEEYGFGGFHPVQIGDTFKNGQFVIINKLGFGQFSTAWTAWDTHHNRYVALKIQKGDTTYVDAAEYEIGILELIREGDPRDEKCVLKLLEWFKFRGPNGLHFCMVLEFLGDNLLTLIKLTNYGGLPMFLVKNICYNILVGLDYLHRELSIIHCDLKLENIALVKPIETPLDPPRFPVPPQLPERYVETLSPKRNAHNASLPDNKDTVTDTSGLTKSQKKRLKRKLKKQAKTKPEESDTRSSEEYAAEKVIVEVPDENAEINEFVLPTLFPALSNHGYKERQKWLRKIDCRCKIIDLGTSYQFDSPLTGSIQTRHYRSPEVIIGAPYSTPVDMWSFACLVFELATGELLFEPQKGYHFSKDEDHLALMIELLGRIPEKIALGGMRSRDFFNNEGQLKRIKKLNFWYLKDVLVQKYDMAVSEATELTEFLLPLFYYDPEKRPTAADCLRHPWLQGAPHINDPFF